MSDSFKDLGFEESFDDLGFQEETQSIEPESTANTAVAKFAQGATLGFDDELAGALSAAGRVAGIEGLGGKMKDIGIAEGGPTLDAEKILNSYRSSRDQIRGMQDQMQKESPYLSTAANIAGGAASMALAPAALVAPVGPAAQGASLGAKSLNMARNAIPTAAIAGLGLSDADITKGDLEGAAAQTVENTALGTGIAGAIPPAIAGVKAIGQGISNVGGALVPDIVKQGFDRGLKNIDIAGQQFYDDVTGRVKDVVERVKSPIIDRAEKNTQAFDKATKAVDDQINQLKLDNDANIELQQAKQMATNAQDIAKFNQESVGLAKKLQTKISEVKSGLGKQYDELENAAAEAGVFPNNQGSISNLEQTLIDKSALQPQQIQAIMKKLQPVLGQRTPDAFKQTKQIYQSYFDHGDPVVRRAMKAAYADLKNGYRDDLIQAGHQGLADRFADTNKRWMAGIELEENFLSNIRPDRVTGQIEPATDTLKAMENFSQKDPSKIAQSDLLSKYLNVFDPQQAPQSINEMQALANKGAQLKSFKPELPPENPEIARMQGLLEQLKANKPNKIEGLDLPVQPEALQNELSALLPKSGMKTGNDVAEKKLAQTMDFLKKEKGEDFVKNLTEELKPLNQDVQLRNLQSRPDQSIPLTPVGMAQKAVGKGANLANKVGLGVAKVSEKAQNAKKFLTKGISGLSDAPKENIDELAQAMAATGEQGAGYAKVLSESASKPQQTKNAIMFSLMQQPKFREIFHQVNGDE